MNEQLLTNQNLWPVTFLASFLIWVMFAALFFLWFFDGRIKRRHVVRALLASFVAWSLSQIIKSLVPTLRPFELNNVPPLTITIPTDAAFPSGHTASAFGLATSVYAQHKKAGLAFIIAAIAIGTGRVLGNVHYVLDIVGGAFLGVSAALVLTKVTRSSRKRKTF